MHFELDTVFAVAEYVIATLISAVLWKYIIDECPFLDDNDRKIFTRNPFAEVEFTGSLGYFFNMVIVITLYVKH
jgi:hypothetical protein